MDYPDKNALAMLEKGLIERFRNGEEDAFAGLAELYKDRLHQFILCILGPDREAEDIAQEAFVQIYKSMGSFRGDCAFSTWAYSITRNVCRHKLRARGREAGLFGELGENDGSAPDMAPSFDLDLENKENGELVRAAVDGLSPLHRAVIFLSCWERLSYGEIARALDIPIGTVRSRIHNAMAALAQKLKPAFNPEVNDNEMPD
jgi:RNA polymerase sigma-70 factor (ECF subfamily)